MKREIFRDTEDWYLKTEEDQAYPRLIKFAIEHAGAKILDVGCGTGDYCNKLKKLEFECIGIDINQKYVEKTIEKGIEAYYMDATNLKFSDNSFDTIILFEVLEHVENPEIVLNEAKRVAKKNVLISVPNCTQFNELKKYGLTYEHMLEKDHINFFTKRDLEKLLSKIFEEFKVEQKEILGPGIVALPGWLRYPILGLYKLKIIKSGAYYRLYAVAVIND